MKRKNSFFLIGMTSVLLAFAMIGCDNGTSNGGSNTPTYPYTPTQPGTTVTTEQELGLAIVTGHPGVYRIVSSFGLTSDLAVSDGQHIVVGGTSGNDDHLFSAGGPLFNATGTNNTFNIGARLTLKSGSSLTIAGGSAVNAISGGELYVEAQAKVGVGVDVSNEAVNIGTGLSSLHAVGGASLYFEDEATLAVTNDPAASKVKVEDKSGAITLMPATKLVVVDANAETPIIGNGKKDDGTTENVIIEIPDGSKATIAVEEVYTAVEDESADSSISEAFNTAKDAVNEASSTPTLSEASQVQDAFDDGATKVTYTGEDALGEIEIPEGTTLVITGEVADGDTDNSFTLADGAKLEITDGASIDFGATGTITIEDEGTVTNNGTLKTSVTEIGTALNGILAAKGKITATGTITVSEAAALTVPADTALTITGLTVGAFKLTVAAVPATSSITFTSITNGGTIAVADAVTLAHILTKVEAGTVEASESLTLGGTPTVQSTATLNIASGKTLTVTGTLTVASGGASVTGAAGAKIELEAAATHSGTSNFYDLTGTELIETTIPVGTYTWDVSGNKWKSTGVNPTPSTDNAGLVAGLLGTEGVTQVTYTGSDPLAGVTVPADKALIITGNIENQAQKITGDGTVENNGTINTATNDDEVLANLVGIPTTASGKVVLNGAVGGVTSAIALSVNLEIGTGGSIEFTGSGDAFSGSGKTVAILVGNTTANALSLGANISGYGSSITVTNAGTHAGAITTATTSVGTLNTLLAVGGNITASAITVGEVESAATAALNVPNSTALTIGTLIVNHANSVLTVTLGTSESTLTITNNITTNAGTIKTANGTVLATLLSKVTAGTIEVTGDAALNSAEIKGTATLKVSSGALTINESNTLKVTGTLSFTDGTLTNNGTIEAADVTKLAAVLGLTDKINGKVQVTGSTASLGATTIPSGVTLVIPGGQELEVTGAIAGAGGISNGGTIALSTASGSINGVATIANTGTIKTVTATTDTELAAFLPKVTGGTVEIVSITLAASTVVTVPSGVTLQLGNGTAAATLTLTNDTSKLVLQAGGKVNAANAGSTIQSGEPASETGVTVSAVNGSSTATKLATTGTQGGGWILTETSSEFTSGTVVIGKFKIVTADATTAITGAEATSTPTPDIGSLTAGTDTTITFAGAET